MLGRNANSLGSSSALDVMEGDGAMVSTVGSGPNKGYAIVDYTAYRVQRFRQVNERVSRPARGRYRTRAPARCATGTISRAEGHDPRELFLGVLRHEGYGGFIAGKKGHQGRSRRRLP